MVRSLHSRTQRVNCKTNHKAYWLVFSGAFLFWSFYCQQVLLPSYSRRTNDLATTVKHASTTNFVADSLANDETVTNKNEHSALVSWRRYTYRVPAVGIARIAAKQSNNDSSIIIGALSTPENGNRRQAVRETWAIDEPIFFMVGGRSFSAIEDEFNIYQDIIWVNMTETYNNIVIKVAVFFDAAYRYFPGSYTLKTDDDVYVQMQSVRETILSLEATNDHEAHYIGGECASHEIDKRTGLESNGVTLAEFARDWLPAYNYGAGYVTSSWFNECLVQAMADKSHMKNEDCFTGILAERCRVPCTKVSNWDALGGIPDPVTKVAFTHLSKIGYESIEIPQLLRDLHTCNQNASHCRVSPGWKPPPTSPPTSAPTTAPTETLRLNKTELSTNQVVSVTRTRTLLTASGNSNKG